MQHTNNPLLNQAAVSIALDTLETALGQALDGWRRGEYESRAFFHTLPKGGFLKVRFCSHAYEPVILVSWFDGIKGSPVVTKECRRACDVTAHIIAFKELHARVTGGSL